LGFYGVAVLIGMERLGITSFTWAVLVRSIVGIIGMAMCVLGDIGLYLKACG